MFNSFFRDKYKKKQPYETTSKSGKINTFINTFDYWTKITLKNKLILKSVNTDHRLTVLSALCLE